MTAKQSYLAHYAGWLAGNEPVATLRNVSPDTVAMLETAFLRQYKVVWSWKDPSHHAIKDWLAETTFHERIKLTHVPPWLKGKL